VIQTLTPRVASKLWDAFAYSLMVSVVELLAAAMRHVERAALPASRSTFTVSSGRVARSVFWK